MNRFPKHLFALLAVLGAAIALGILCSPATSVGLPDAFHIHFPTGQQFEYDFDFHAETDAPNVSAPQAGGGGTGLDGERLQGALRLSGKLRVQGVGGAPGGGSYVQYQIAKADEVGILFMGAALPMERKDRQALEATGVIARLSKFGDILSLHFPKDTPLQVRQILRPLLVELQVVLRPNAQTWQVLQQSFNGPAKTRYSFEGDDNSMFRVSRKALSFHPLTTVGPELSNHTPDIAGRFDIALHHHGYLAKLDGRQEVTVNVDGRNTRSTVSLSLRLKGHKPTKERSITEAHLSAMDPLDPADVPGQELAEKGALKNRIAGYTVEKLQADLLKFGNAGKMPNHQQWLFRSVGLLLAHPEKSAELAELFFDERLGEKAQNLVIDLLANAGHPSAQKAMRTILGDTRTQSLGGYARLVQSTGLVARPEAETVAFLHTMARTAPQEKGRAGSMVALGTGIGRLIERGDVDLAQKHNAGLQALAKNATSDTEVQGLLYGIGNTGLEENLEFLGSYLKSDNEKTRATATRALRKLKSPKARAQLRAMVVDRSPAVQRQAIRALRTNKIGIEDVATLEAGVRSGDLGRRALLALMRDVPSALDSGVDAQSLVAALRTRVGTDQELRRHVNEFAARLAEGSR